MASGESPGWRPGDNNIGDCRYVTWEEMWERFRVTYRNHYPEHELRRIHDKWRRLTAEVAGI